MKTTLKLSTLLVALASVFTFSSCLDDDNSGSNSANYYSAVTIAGDDLFGYTFYSDFGATLIPTSTSVQEAIPNLGKSGAKRAYIAFDLASETDNGQNLVAGQTYNIIVREHYYGQPNYAIPTYNTIDMAGNAAAADSLTNNNERINNVNNSIWAINGYLNAQLTLNYDPSKAFYINTYYDSEKDVNVAEKTLSLNLYYNSKSQYASTSGSGVFSFSLPQKEYIEFAQSHSETDSIKIILNAITNYESKELTKVGECKIAIKDFDIPRGY